jgi:hypothetical protein
VGGSPGLHPALLASFAPGIRAFGRHDARQEDDTMHRLFFTLLGAIAVIASLSANGVAAQENGVPPGTSATVDNPFFPLPPGYSHTYEGQEVNPDTGETVDTYVHEHTSPVAQEINGVPVTEIKVQEYNDGQLVEGTSDYHAQAPDGSVYYLGENVNQYDNGQITGHEGTWIAGEDANQAGEFMPADPQVGDRFTQERAPGVAEDNSTVIATDQTVETPAGTFSGCIKTQDQDPLEASIEYKYYCPGVGLTREESATGSDELVSQRGG